MLRQHALHVVCNCFTDTKLQCTTACVISIAPGQDGRLDGGRAGPQNGRRDRQRYGQRDWWTDGRRAGRQDGR